MMEPYLHKPTQTSINVLPDNHFILTNVYQFPPLKNKRDFPTESGVTFFLSGFPKGIVPYSYSVICDGPSGYEVISYTHPEKLSSLHIGKVAKYTSSSKVTIRLNDTSVIIGTLLSDEDASGDPIVLAKGPKSPTGKDTTEIIKVMRKYIAYMCVEQLEPHQENMILHVIPTENGRERETDRIKVEMQLNSFSLFFQAICNILEFTSYPMTKRKNTESLKAFMNMSTTTSFCTLDIKVSYSNDTGMSLTNSSLLFSFRKINWSYSPSGDYGHRYYEKESYETAVAPRGLKETTHSPSYPTEKERENPLLSKTITISPIDIYEGENTHSAYRVPLYVSFVHVVKIGSTTREMAKVNAIFHHIQHEETVIIPNTRFTIEAAGTKLGEGIIDRLVTPRLKSDLDPFTEGTYASVYISESSSIVANVSHEAYNEDYEDKRQGGITKSTTKATISNISVLPIRNIALLKYFRENEIIVYNSIYEMETEKTPNGHQVKMEVLSTDESHPLNDISLRKWYEKGGKLAIYTISQLDSSESFSLVVKTNSQY